MSCLDRMFGNFTTANVLCASRRGRQTQLGSYRQTHGLFVTTTCVRPPTETRVLE